jgi:tetratricopeptide (TPR) repeat protein
LGLDPLALLIPSMGAYALPSVLALILAWMLVRRSQRLKEGIDAAVARLETTREQERTTLARFEAVMAEAGQIADEVRDIRQVMTQYEVLLPGKLLLLQRRYDEATKVLQEAVASQPTSTEARWLLGEALMGGKRHAEALPHLLTGLVEADRHRLTMVAQCEQALGRYADAEAHLLQLIEVHGAPQQDDLVALGTIQGELDPVRARETLTQALALNPHNSVARYQLLELETRTGAYEHAITLATDGLKRNPADVGCFVSRAEAYFRRGRFEDDAYVLDDLATAQARNRKDYNIYRLRGALYQRRASRADGAAENRQALHKALEAYADGLANVPPKFHAHLLAAESRILLQLRRFEEAAAQAQRAVNHYQGHVSNHLALAFARLSTRQWEAAAQAADRGMQWAGWGGRIWLTAIGIFANAFMGVKPSALRQKCATLATDLKADARRFALSESWSVVREVLRESANGTANSCGALVVDTIALLEQVMTPEQYHRRWAETQGTGRHSAAHHAVKT